MSGSLARWRPALRMARRDLGRHKVRALLTCLLVALPAIVATVASLASHNSRWTPEVSATETMGAADGELLVTPYAEVVNGRRSLWLEPTPAAFETGDGAAAGGERTPLRRDPASVDLAGLLPAGSELVRSGPQTSGRRATLATGGSAEVRFLELGSAVAAPLARITEGAAPSGPDEVAVPAYVGEELGLLEPSGEPTDGAALELTDGSALRVVGVYEARYSWEAGGLSLVASPDSRLNRASGGRSGYLVDLPDLTRDELKELARELNAAGVAFRPRDAVLHPRAWGLSEETGGGTDITSLVVGAFCILVGMLEVVLLVGAAFAVAARRQVRDLGLLAANGGAGADVRRVLLAQGLVLGVVSSLVGTALGVALFLGAHSRLEAVFGGFVPWRSEIDWRAVVLVALLGSTTSVVAALLPSWSLSRLTPVAALSGRFPLRPGESRAHRGAFVLAGAGLALLVLGGWATARTFGPRGGQVSLAPAVAALGLLVLVAGVVWAAPWLVRQAARGGAHLPLSGRYAFRDAGRHRFRSASAVVALGVTVAGAVMASFIVAAAVRQDATQGWLPDHALQVEPPGAPAVSPERLAAIGSTLERVVGDVDLVATSELGPADRPDGQVVVAGRRVVQTADRATVARLLAPGQPEVLEAFDAGAVVQLDPRAPSAGAETVRLRLDGSRKQRSWTVPAVAGQPSDLFRDGRDTITSALLSREAAAGLGLAPQWTQLIALADRAVTNDDLDRLRVYGLYAWSADPDAASVSRVHYVGLGLAGLVTALVVGVAVALAAAESRDEVATLAAVGAGPGRRRALGAMHGLFLGLVGGAVGVPVGVVAGISLGQVDGLPGVAVPWAATAATLVAVLVLAPVAGWLVTPSRLDLSRRTA